MTASIKDKRQHVHKIIEVPKPENTLMRFEFKPIATFSTLMFFHNLQVDNRIIKKVECIIYSNWLYGKMVKTFDKRECNFVTACVCHYIPVFFCKVMKYPSMSPLSTMTNSSTMLHCT